MFKILNGYGNIDSNIFFEIKESKITRGHNYTLVKKHSRLDVIVGVLSDKNLHFIVQLFPLAQMQFRTIQDI